MMRGNVIIQVEGLWKRYGLPMGYTFQRYIKRWRQKQKAIDAHDGFWALKNINFEVRRGETLGIIGYNGAGKSTLLKVLAGVTPPTRGKIETAGKTFPMIELTAGINKELTGKENIFLLGVIMGIPRQKVKTKMPKIVEFCELGEWLNQPVWKYSSGMIARLGFGVAVNMNADILLIDEVLAVGDLAFKRKCYTRFEQLRKEGTATLFVSHNMRQIERICDRVIFLERGNIVQQGQADKVCSLYYEKANKSEIQAAKTMLPANATWESSGELIVENVEILNETYQQINTLKTLDSIWIKTRFKAEEEIVNPIIGFTILTSDMIRVSGFGTGHEYQERICLEGNDSFEVFIPSLNLLPGLYSVALAIKSHDGRKIYYGQNLTQFEIEYSPVIKDSMGLIHIDADWKFSGAHLASKNRSTLCI